MTDFNNVSADPSAEFDAMFGSDINAPVASHESKSTKSLRKSQRHYALAAFIAGCLIQEEVIAYDPNDSDTVSDLECGIRIIAACLKNYIDNEESFGLPFEW